MLQSDFLFGFSPLLSFILFVTYFAGATKASLAFSVSYSCEIKIDCSTTKFSVVIKITNRVLTVNIIKSRRAWVVLTFVYYIVDLSIGTGNKLQPVHRE